VLLFFSGMVATRGMISKPRKQQIPPLRCASVGMTDYVSNFRHRMAAWYPKDGLSTTGFNQS
jgi:hypothetical protein